MKLFPSILLLLVTVQPLMLIAGENHEKACGLFKHYEKCGTVCPKHCKNWKKNESCPIQTCVAGCFCNEGYVLEYEGSHYCVQADKCDSCPENSDYRSCGVNCQPRCDGHDNCWWSLRCFPGCICRKGFFLHSNKCYPKDQCPVMAIDPSIHDGIAQQEADRRGRHHFPL